MQNLIITGGRRLEGAVRIHGAKNSVLPLISATVLLSGKSVLHNCPDLSDVTAALSILGLLGLSYNKSGTDIEIISREPDNYRIPGELMRSMRSSIMFLGAILARKGKAIISAPGGCRLGPRPIDMHISALRRLGVSVSASGGELTFTAQNGISGADVFLDFPSVGVTENVIMAAALGKGITRIFNAAREPEIVDLADFLNKAGAGILGAGTELITINGVHALHGAEHTVIPDRIEAATYMCAAAATGGKITLESVNSGHLSAVSHTLAECGCIIRGTGDTLDITAPPRLKPPRAVITDVYPGFPTDAGPLLIAALSLSEGISVFCERIFKNRYCFVGELEKLGANIQISGPVAVITGSRKLTGARCTCTDLRGGAALVIAALGTAGKTEIGNLCHIRRGYQDLGKNLRLLGAQVSEIQREDF